jgi:hypothetical protein
MKTKFLVTILTPLIVFTIRSASAAIVEDVGQRASSDLPSFGRIATYATNGAGLSGNDHSEIPFRTMWLSSAGDVAGAFEIDLGGVYSVTSIRVWNYNEFVSGRPDLLQRGVALANIDFGMSPDSYTTVVANRAFLQAPGTFSDFSEVINLSGAPTRFVRLDILSNHGDPQYTGLSEIQIEGTFVSGQQPIRTTIATTSSTIGAPYDRGADHAIDRSGLFARTHSITPDGNMWLAAQFDVAPTITFDLGSIQNLSSMLFWNYNEFLPGRTDLLTRGISQADILLSNDGISFTPFATDVAFAMAPGDNTTDFAQTVNMAGASARFVQIAVDANYGNVEYTGLSEVQFFAIPEPSSHFLATAGALIALLFSRGRRVGINRRADIAW